MTINISLKNKFLAHTLTGFSISVVFKAGELVIG